MKHVYRVLHRTYTSGRDSGYPASDYVGPLFASIRDAETEASRLLALLSESERKTVTWPTLNPATNTYSGPPESLPVYEAVPVEVLGRPEAQERRIAMDQAIADRQIAEAERLEAQAARLREMRDLAHGIGKGPKVTGLTSLLP